MWVTLTVDQIQNSLSTTERLAMTAVDSAADLQDILQSVTALIVGKVNSFAPNQSILGPIGTIPDETLAAAIAISRYKFLTSLPGTQLITKWREQENTEAYTILDQVASGALKIVSGNPNQPGVAQRQATTSPTGTPGDSGETYFPPYLTPGTPSPVWGGGGYW